MWNWWYFICQAGKQLSKDSDSGAVVHLLQAVAAVCEQLAKVGKPLEHPVVRWFC